MLPLPPRYLSFAGCLSWLPGRFHSRYAAEVLPGSNGIAEIVDEEQWDLEWLNCGDFTYSQGK
jgi:hypothetical protein